MSYYSSSIAANGVWEINDPGRFFRILTASGAVSVEFYKNGSRISGTENVLGGFFRESRSDQDYDRIRIVDMSGAINVVEIMSDMERIGYDRMSISGSVDTVAKATPAQAAATVTNVSAQLLAAKTARKYLLIQNKDAAGSIYVNLAGAAATTANGVKIPPGGYLESGAAWVSNAAIFAIGDITSNANIVTVEA